MGTGLWLRRLVVLDWRSRRSSSSRPVTYMHEGKQYLVIAVGSGGRDAELLALTLPE